MLHIEVHRVNLIIIRTCESRVFNNTLLLSQSFTKSENNLRQPTVNKLKNSFVHTTK